MVEAHHFEKEVKYNWEYYHKYNCEYHRKHKDEIHARKHKYYLENRERILSKGRRGNVWTEERRRRHSEALRGRVFSEEHKRKIGLAHKGKVIPQNVIVKMKQTKLRSGADMRCSERMMGNKIWVGRKHKLETRLKIKEKHSTYEMRELHRKIMMSIKRSPTDIERVVMLQLNRLGKQYIFQYGLEGYLYDFYIPEEGILIECDGEYWHAMERARMRDVEKDACAERYGLRLIRLPGKEIMREGFEIKMVVTDGN